MSEAYEAEEQCLFLRLPVPSVHAGPFMRSSPGDPALGEDPCSYGANLVDSDGGESGTMTERAKARPAGDAGTRDDRLW